MQTIPSPQISPKPVAFSNCCANSILCSSISQQAVLTTIPTFSGPLISPPPDGYQPPEDPLVGVARQVDITAQIKKQFSDLLIVGTAYSYLQEFLPHVAQALVRDGKVDFIGLGRMVLSYPDLPVDVLQKAEASKRKTLPHLQRLHHRPPKWHDIGLLSTGYLLQKIPRRHCPQGTQKIDSIVTLHLSICEWVLSTKTSSKLWKFTPGDRITSLNKPCASSPNSTTCPT